MNGDIMPLNSPLGGHMEMRSYARGVTVPYGYGEWVVLAANVIDGLAEAAADVDLTAATVGNHFIAAGPYMKNVALSDTGEGQIRLDRVGDTRYVDPPTTTVLDPVYALDWNTEFITKFLFTADTDAFTVPTAAHIGVAVGPHHATAETAPTQDRHGVGLGGAGLVITRVLNAQKNDIQTHGGTGTYVVFRRNI